MKPGSGVRFFLLGGLDEDVSPVSFRALPVTDSLWPYDDRFFGGSAELSLTLVKGQT